MSQHDRCTAGLEKSSVKRKMEVCRKDVAKKISGTNRLLMELALWQNVLVRLCKIEEKSATGMKNTKEMRKQDRY